jgi:hypothetical protein
LAAGQTLDYLARSRVRQKKRRRDRLIELAHRYDWVIGYLDEVWWSRFALPHMQMWSDEEHPARLHRQPRPAEDPDPQALACYGLWCDRQQEMFLRFVTGRPVSVVTTAFLDWTCRELGQRGHRVLVLIWDNASWHVSAEVREWIAAHNAAAKQRGEGVRILVVGLPTKSPWLNKIEPKWQHGKEAIVERDEVLTAVEMEARVCAYYDTPVQEHLVQPPPTPRRGRRAAEAAALLEASRGQQAAHAVKPQQAA